MAAKIADALLLQYIDRVVDVPVDKEPDEAALAAEESGACCTKCYSDAEPFTDILPDGVATIAVQAQTTENFADESLYFHSLSVERPYQVHQVTTQKVMVPDYPECSDVPYANPVVQTEEKIVELQQVQFIERIVEVLQIQCWEGIRHMTVPQVQEVIRQVTVSHMVVLEVDE